MLEKKPCYNCLTGALTVFRCSLRSCSNAQMVEATYDIPGNTNFAFLYITIISEMNQIHESFYVKRHHGGTGWITGQVKSNLW
jgi:hypothetical protein